MQPQTHDSLALEDERAAPFDVLELLIEAVSAEGASPNAFSLEWLMARLDAPELAS